MNKEEVLSNWVQMNNALRSATEEECSELLEEEKKSRNRLAFLLRIYGRYNQLRADRERRELMTVTETKKGKKHGAGS